MNDVVVSIIIPTLNREAYIGFAIQSILSQTYPHWECIVVDDGSTDNTAKIMADFSQQDTRIAYFKRSNDFPKGVNGARNFGLSKSKGALIAFCDDDDFWLSDKLEKQIPVFKSNPEVGLVTGNIEFVNTDGVRTGRVIKQRGNHGYVFKDLLFKNRLSMITPVLRREVFDTVGVFNTDFRIEEDWEMWRRVAYYYPFYALPDVLACVRKHDDNTSRMVNTDPYEQFIRYRALTKALLKWGELHFTKKDRGLIAKVEAKRYKQLLKNHCPGLQIKVNLIISVFKINIQEGMRFGYFLLKYGVFNK
ncbi:glycosyltransferase family 2 protein [Winogradskyella rapida]|uniref:Glycosyltransferase family 2 protein n=1 Tax=Winogradskyella rapida TaxID=549701 RepID=A0ABW3KME1_9FLAO